MATIGFIGMGNMGSAILKGLLRSCDSADIIFSCKTEEKRNKVVNELKVKAAASNAEVAANADFIVLAVKPQVFAEVFEELNDAEKNGLDFKKKIFISLAPGKTIEYISGCLGGARVVRAMPNTPALIGCGMTGVAYDEVLFSADEISVIDTIFSSIGKYEKVSEEQISAVVCASGSSPAYVYLFIEKLTETAVEKGLPKEQALKMVSEAVLGSARMVLESGESPDILRQRVCSKGGTTLAGLAAMEENGFSKSIEAATEACYKRCLEL